MTGNDIILSSSKLGTLIWASNQGIPTFVPGKHIDEEIIYTNSKDTPWVNDYLPKGWEDIDADRAMLGKIRLDINDPAYYNNFSVMLVPTTVCGMSCNYCYAGVHSGDYEKVGIDFNWLGAFLDKHKDRILSVIVYGGDSLMQDKLPFFLRQRMRTKGYSKMHFVTGLGYTVPVYQRKVARVLSLGGTLTLSIDPPPDEGNTYTRVFKLYPGNNGRDWYDELLKRVRWITDTFPHPRGQDGRPHIPWGIRPSMTRFGWDILKLRKDLLEASGLQQININVEAGVDEKFDPNTPDIVQKMNVMLDEEVRQITTGKLDVRYCQHYVDRLRAIIDPYQHFTPGGCYSWFNRVALGPRGEMSFCNESPTYELPRRENWTFGMTGNMDNVKYAETMQKLAARPEACQDCNHRYTCGTSCPVKLMEELDGGCAFSSLKGEKILKIMANVDNPEFINKTTEIRMANLRKWQSSEAVNYDDFLEHANRWKL